jgi:hypothetical protein
VDPSDLPRAYRIGLRLRDLGADDDLIAECLGMDPAGIPVLLHIGLRKLTNGLDVVSVSDPENHECRSET